MKRVFDIFGLSGGSDFVYSGIVGGDGRPLDVQRASLVLV